MGAKFDSEDLIDSILATMQSGLNAKIAAVEAEKTAAGKGLSPTLKAIGGYHEQTWDNGILQKSPCVFYGIANVAAADGGQSASKEYKIFCEVVYVDNGQFRDGWKRMSRYSRALEELFSASFPNIPGHFKIEQVEPVSFKNELNTSEEIKVSGVLLSVTLY